MMPSTISQYTRSPPSKLLAIFILLSTLVLSAHADTTPNNVNLNLIRRAEAVGASCESEGQWYCMTNSFQRCASGQWSAEMRCSEGTICTPSGYSDVFRIDYEDGRNDNQAPTTGGASVGFGGSMSMGLVKVVLGLWVLMGFLF